MKIQQQLNKLSRICEKSEIDAITRKIEAYLNGVMKNKNIDNFGNEVSILKKKLREKIDILDKEMKDHCFTMFAKTKNKAYANYIDEIEEINKGNYKPTEEMLKWEDLMQYVGTKYK